MYLLAVQLTHMANPALFKFNGKPRADKEFEAVQMASGPAENAAFSPKYLVIEDDHGHKRCFWSSNVENVALIDMEKDIDGQIQMQLLQHRGQAKGQRLAQADPSLRLTGAPMIGGLNS